MRDLQILYDLPVAVERKDPPGMRKFLQQSHLLAVHAKQPSPVSSLVLKGFEGANNSFKLLDLLYETRMAPSGRICLARSSLSIILLCLRIYLTNIRRPRIELANKSARSTLVPTFTPTRLMACHAPDFVKYFKNVLTIMPTIRQIF